MSTLISPCFRFIVIFEEMLHGPPSRVGLNLLGEIKKKKNKPSGNESFIAFLSLFDFLSLHKIMLKLFSSYLRLFD